MTRKHLIIPDCQVKPTYSSDYLTTVGNYIVAKRPDVVVCLGDFADMPSLSSYDRGNKSYEGRRYVADISAAKVAMGNLMRPLETLQSTQRKNKERVYRPELQLCYGNHEHRILKAADSDPKLDGLLKLEDLEYEKHGWTTHPFLVPVVIDGVVYCHYLVSGVMGRPITSASAILAKRHQSCVVGHQQGRQVAYATRADGTEITAIIAGSCYEHNEDYMGPQGNKHWRGVIMLHEVEDGHFDEMLVSLKFLKENYS